MTEYLQQEKGADEVGKVIAQLAQCFAGISKDLAVAEKVFNTKYAEIVSAPDEASGKPIAVSKAEILAKATTQYHDVNVLKKELSAIEQEINALKSLQRGLMNEYSHVGAI